LATFEVTAYGDSWVTAEATESTVAAGASGNGSTGQSAGAAGSTGAATTGSATGVVGGCGCNSAPGDSLVLAAVLAALGLRRRAARPKNSVTDKARS
jgi:MYXO-CTERM domain-containing protein